MHKIIEVDESIKEKVSRFLEVNWGAPTIVTRGKRHIVESLKGFALIQEDEIKALITYAINDDQCEIVSLDSLIENQGIGTRLIDKVTEKAKEQKCKRVWLITTNDNTKAIRFYQRRGLNMAAIHLNAIEISRKIKPQIPLYGFDDIPILHEIEFEKLL